MDHSGWGSWTLGEGECVEPLGGRVPDDEAALLVLGLQQGLRPLPGHVPDVPVEAGQPEVVELLDVVGGDEADLPGGVLHLPPVVLHHTED